MGRNSSREQTDLRKFARRGKRAKPNASDGTLDGGAPSWGEVKKRLGKMADEELVALLGECYRASPDMRVKISLAVSRGRGENKRILADLKKRLHAIFNTYERNGCPRRPDLKEARAIITLAKRSADDPPALVDLMLSYLEEGIDHTQRHGDMWPGFYGSIESVFEKTCEYILEHRTNVDLDATLARIDADISEVRMMGWGFHENLSYVRDELTQKLGGKYDDTGIIP